MSIWRKLRNNKASDGQYQTLFKIGPLTLLRSPLSFYRILDYEATDIFFDFKWNDTAATTEESFKLLSHQRTVFAVSTRTDKVTNACLDASKSIQLSGGRGCPIDGHGRGHSKGWGGGGCPIDVWQVHRLSDEPEKLGLNDPPVSANGVICSGLRTIKKYRTLFGKPKESPRKIIALGVRLPHDSYKHLNSCTTTAVHGLIDYAVIGRPIYLAANPVEAAAAYRQALATD